MTAAPPITAAEKARILEAIKAGERRNDISRRFGRSPSTVSKIAHDAGLNFDRTATAAATKAKQHDNRARRAALAPEFLAKAEQALDKINEAISRMSGPTVVYNFGGRDNVYEEHTLDQPPMEVIRAAAAAVRDLMQTAKTATAAVLDMERVDTPPDGAGVLEHLVDAIAAARSNADA